MTETIILIPHCLKKYFQELIIEYARNHNHIVFIANGSSEAISIINQYPASKVVAIACEKELYMCKEILKADGQDISRISSVSLKTTGCRNTELNIIEVFEKCLNQ